MQLLFFDGYVFTRYFKLPFIVQRILGRFFNLGDRFIKRHCIASRCNLCGTLIFPEQTDDKLSSGQSPARVARADGVAKASEALTATLAKIFDALLFHEVACRGVTRGERSSYLQGLSTNNFLTMSRYSVFLQSNP